MVNFKRIGTFIFRVILLALPFLMLILALGFVTELATATAPKEEVLRAPAFWVAVLINGVPPILVMVAALWLAGRFVAGVFRLDSPGDGFKFLLYSRCGQPGFAPWAKVEKGGVAPGGAASVTKVGGPGHLVVYNDSAVVLERAGQLTRVAGPGFPCLEPFETIYDVIDLRPKRYLYDVSAITRDGIPVNWEVEVRYQIDDAGQRATCWTPYPFSEDAVVRAATCQWRREPRFKFGQDMDWEGLVVVSRTEGTLRTIVADHYLDDLIGLDKPKEKAAREAVCDELRRQLTQKVPVLGAKILEVRLGNLKVEDGVTQQWIDAWKAGWQRWSTRQLARGEASSIYLQETVKAESQMSLIFSVAKALQEYPSAGPAMSQVILNRLFSALDRARLSAASRVFVPTQALDALERIRQLAGGSATPTPAATDLHLGVRQQNGSPQDDVAT